MTAAPQAAKRLNLLLRAFARAVFLELRRGHPTRGLTFSTLRYGFSRIESRHFVSHIVQTPWPFREF